MGLFKFAGGTRLIDVKDRHVNDYIQSIVGDEFTAKDFRTWAGTLLCSIALAWQGQGRSKTERKLKMRNAIVATAEQLGNTPAVCRSSYICPRLLDEYLEGKPFETLRRREEAVPSSVRTIDRRARSAEVPARDDCGPAESAASGVRVLVAGHRSQVMGALALNAHATCDPRPPPSERLPDPEAGPRLPCRVPQVVALGEVPVQFEPEEIEGESHPTDERPSWSRPPCRNLKRCPVSRLTPLKFAAPMSKNSSPRIC